jgi:hypothetical protein
MVMKESANGLALNPCHDLYRLFCTFMCMMKDYLAVVIG